MSTRNGSPSWFRWALAGSVPEIIGVAATFTTGVGRFAGIDLVRKRETMAGAMIAVGVVWTISGLDGGAVHGSGVVRLSAWRESIAA